MDVPHFQESLEINQTNKSKNIILCISVAKILKTKSIPRCLHILVLWYSSVMHFGRPAWNLKNGIWGRSDRKLLCPSSAFYNHFNFKHQRLPDSLSIALCQQNGIVRGSHSQSPQRSYPFSALGVSEICSVRSCKERDRQSDLREMTLSPLRVAESGFTMNCTATPVFHEFVFFL